jgi:hypothetical protein
MPGSLANSLRQGVTAVTKPVLASIQITAQQQLATPRRRKDSNSNTYSVTWGCTKDLSASNLNYNSKKSVTNVSQCGDATCISIASSNHQHEANDTYSATSDCMMG